jgi:5-methylcytosine-specific restriction endonuclease McrA
MKKTPYLKNYKKLTPELQKAVVQMYKTGKYTTESIAKNYDISVRYVQRLAKRAGVIRTQAEANKLVAPLKHYHHVPIEFKVKRKHLTRRKRYELIAAQPYCTTCGLTVKDGIRLEIDHIDEDPSNNEDANLQVLCGLCNQGKSHANRFA